MTNEARLRAQICEIGRLMHAKDFIDGSAGNISARLAGDRVLATPSGLAKGFMTPEQLIVVNLDGERVDTPTPANADLRPTSELAMHLECYRQRPDVGGVVHAHPTYSVALTLVDYDFSRAIVPEAVVLLGAVPVTPYATPASVENRDAIRGLIGQHDAILLAHHGSLTVANTVWDAYLLLETLEHTAHILYLAGQVGQPHTLPAHQVAKLLRIREGLGLAREGDAARFGVQGVGANPEPASPRP